MLDVKKEIQEGNDQKMAHPLDVSLIEIFTPIVDTIQCNKIR